MAMELPQLLSGHITYDEESKVITTIDDPYVVHPQGLGHMLFHLIKQHKGKMSQLEIDGGNSETYDELYTKSVRTAIFMKNMGVKPGDLVTIYAENELDAGAAFVAISLIGAINVAIDTGLSKSDSEDLFKQVEPKVIFVSTSTEQHTEELMKKYEQSPKIVVFGETDTNIKFSEVVEPKEGEEDFEPYVVKDLDEICFIKFSSGTTGVPKGICWNHKFTIYQSRMNTIPPRCLFFTSFYWISTSLGFIMTIRNGTAKLTSKKFVPELLWEQIEKYQVDYVGMSAYQSIKFTEAKPEGHTTRLLAFVIGGSTTSKEYLIKIRQALPKTIVFMPFSQTESGLLFYNFNEKALPKIESVGVPCMNITYKIVDTETGKNVGFNQRGELRVKSDWFCSGYYKRDSSDLFDSEGFLCTGDIFYFDEDFCFFCVDRLKEMFKYRGYYVYPTKYEPFLLSHPAVDSCIIFGVPDIIDDHHLCAVVVVKPGHKVTPEELEEYYNGQVNVECRIKAGLKIVDSFPMTPTGKISKGQLKRKILNEYFS